MEKTALKPKINISILGCGRWGSFHAWYQAEILKNNVVLWGRKGDQLLTELMETRKNSFLTLPNSIKLSDDLKQALNHAQHIIIAISAQGVKEFAEILKAHNPRNKTFVLCMKGVCEETGERLSEIIKANVDSSNKVCVWVGPGHVQDFLSGQPNVMIITSENKADADAVGQQFSSGLIKFYTGNDIIGAEIGAAAKNVLGIAAGMLDGAGAHSLKGALMARGTYEVACLIAAMGGKFMTAYGLAHLGDFEATLFSKNSHNRMYGEELIKALKQGRLPQGIGLAEGIATSKAINLLSQKYNVDMPICKTVYKILHENESPHERFQQLFLRPFTEEFRHQ